VSSSLTACPRYGAARRDDAAGVERSVNLVGRAERTDLAAIVGKPAVPAVTIGRLRPAAVLYSPVIALPSQAERQQPDQR